MRLVTTLGSVGGGPYPPGLRVGTVASVDPPRGQLTATASVRPAVDPTTLDVVGVLLPTTRAAARPPVAGHRAVRRPSPLDALRAGVIVLAALLAVVARAPAGPAGRRSAPTWSCPSWSRPPCWVARSVVRWWAWARAGSSTSARPGRRCSARPPCCTPAPAPSRGCCAVRARGRCCGRWRATAATATAVAVARLLVEVTTTGTVAGVGQPLLRVLLTSALGAVLVPSLLRVERAMIRRRLA